MNKKLPIALFLVAIITGIYLRFAHYLDYASFDWDQNRDYQAVAKIASGIPTLVGPVAKGDGGFILGPLYYYLLVPGFLVSHGNPRALPVTSMVIDIATIAAIYFLFRRRLGIIPTLIVTSFWAFSPFLIGWSRTSWNVALVPVWTSALLAAYFDFEKHPSRALISFGALFGLSWHIHAAIIPLAPLLAIASFRSWPKSWQAYLGAAGAAALGYLPLFLFDLRHVWFNSHLMLTTLAAGQSVHMPFAKVIPDVIMKLGKNTYGLILGSFIVSPFLGWLTLSMSTYFLFTNNRLVKGSALVIILITLLAIFLRDTGFPEYYLAAAYLPTLIIFTFAAKEIFRSPWLYAPVAMIVLILLLLQPVPSPSPFSLSVKERLVESLASVSKTLDVRFDLPVGRDGGLRPMLRLAGITLDSASKNKVIITDNFAGPMYIDGELATDLARIGGLRAAYYQGVK